MATLEERIQRLEDIRECEQLQYKYEYYLDHGYDGDALLRCSYLTGCGR